MQTELVQRVQLSLTKRRPAKRSLTKRNRPKRDRGVQQARAAIYLSVGKLPGPSAPTVQLHLDSINRVLGKLFAALDRQSPYAEYRRQNKFNEESQIAYGEAHADVNLARSNVRLEIIKEMERGCRPGAFSPSCGSADLRQRGELIAAAYAGQMGEGDVRDVIEGQQISRVAQGVKRVSEASKDPTKNLNDAQTQEFEDILADAADFIMTPRRGGNPNEARFEQFLRLRRLLDNIKDAGGNLHPDVFARVVISCMTAMKISGAADIDELSRVTRAYLQSANP